MNKQYLVYYDNDIICTGIPEVDILLDEANLIKLEKKYNIKIVNKTEPMECEELYGYMINAIDDSIHFVVKKGFVSNDYNHSVVWNIIYSCDLNIENNKASNENGYGDLAFWNEEIKDNFSYSLDSGLNLCLNEDYINELRKIFPSLVYYNRFSDFLDIYMRKGIYINNISFNVDIINKCKVTPFIGNQYNSEKDVKYAQMKQFIYNNNIFFEVCIIKGPVTNGKMDIKSKGYAYISKDYVYNDSLDLEDLMDKDLIYSRFRFEEFCKKYPELMLDTYLNTGGKYIIPFILSSNHNNVLELAGKAGCGYIADRIYGEKNFVISELNLMGKNLKEIFGLPVKAMRAINKPEIQQGKDAFSFSFLRRLYESSPSIFNFKLTVPMLTFIQSESLLTDFYTKIVKSKRFFDMLRYTQNLSETDVKLYIDYLRMCRLDGISNYGWTPQHLKNAHDAMIIYMNEKREAINNVNFELAVIKPDYQNLIWESGLYCFLIPRNANDLVEESYQQRNCVRSYIGSVASGYKYIIFLRTKSHKNKSLITIEVNCKRRTLEQAKGFGNSPISDSMVTLIKKWCDEKIIDYTNCSDIKPDRFKRGW